MTVEVAQGRINTGGRVAFEGVLHDLHQEKGVVISRGDLTGGGVLVPQLPGLEVHQRLNVEGGHGEVAGVLLVQRRHGFGERDVEFRRVAHVEHGRVRSVSSLGGVALGEGHDEVLFEFGAVVHHGDGLLNGVVARAKTGGPVVVGGQAVSDAPVGHGAVGVKLGTSSEASDGLLVVVVQVVSVGFNEHLAGFVVGASHGGRKCVIRFFAKIILLWCKRHGFPSPPSI